MSGTLDIEGVDPDVRQGYSTSLGRVKIISQAEFVKTHSSFFKETLFFGLSSAALILIPFYMLFKTRAALRSISVPRKLN